MDGIVLVSITFPNKVHSDIDCVLAGHTSWAHSSGPSSQAISQRTSPGDGSSGSAQSPKLSISS